MRYFYPVIISVITVFNSVFFQPVDSISDDSFHVLMQEIERENCGLSINGTNASVTCYAHATSSSNTKIELVADLQEKNVLLWKSIKTWQKTVNASDCSLNGSATVDKNKTYRVKLHITVTSATGTESKTIYSSQSVSH
jgi:hypothetical protein